MGCVDSGQPVMEPARVVGDYVLGPRIGSGSFAVVRLARHRNLGTEVAVKEIDRKLLSPKIGDNLLKEISILSTIDHPNIIRLYEAIETSDKIYIVLEYCRGGDLAGYIHRHGKVSESVARHFMRQLAAGLQVLQEMHLIHRDLKPQNLLLSTDEATPLLKIGDFGFARSLTPEDLAATLCGSPLYMAPEIIQNQKYDAKADLWSVGAILYQLVTGKPPFNGNNHIQLFQNILRCTELQFPEGALDELHPDCLDLCRSLLRRNPVERLTFKEFFDHKFLQEPRQTQEITFQQFDSFLDSRDSLIVSQALQPSVYYDKTKKFEEGQCSSSQPEVVDSMELLEREYVLVNPHSASTEDSICSLGTSLKGLAVTSEPLILAPGGSGVAECQPIDGSGSREVQRLSEIHPPTRLRLLHQYAQVLAEVADDKFNAGQARASFSIELVVLAVWTKALTMCDSSLHSSEEQLSFGSSSNREPQNVPENSYNSYFSSLPFSKSWVTQEFVIAYNRAEKLSDHLKETDANTQMPDAMELIYQRAIAFGKSGGVDEYMNYKTSAATLYTKAILLLSFLIEEAITLPLNPPFLLSPDNKRRIQNYVINLQYRRSQI